MLSWFNTLIKIFSNQSKKLCGEFQKLCEKTLIDHHTTSQNHLSKVDGLAKMDDEGGEIRFVVVWALKWPC
jgi:hypothetical protein